jgi:mannosyltransferase
MNFFVTGPNKTLASPWPWVGLVTLLAAWLRIAKLNSGLWWDEIYFLVTTVRRPLPEIMTVFPGDTQHPLYSILAWLSVDLFGESPWSLRLPAIVFGVACIPMLYLLGASVTSRIEALLAATFLAVSYHHVWFSQNARGYSALAFFTLLSTYFLLRARASGRLGLYAAYAVAAALGAYTHLTMVFVVASHVLIFAAVAVADWRRGGLQKLKAPLFGFLLAGGLILLLYAPILMQVQNFFVHRPSSMKTVSTPLWALFETLRGLTIGLGTQGILFGASLVVACGAWSYFRRNPFVFALFALPAVLTALGAFASRGTMYPRFYFSLLGFAVLILVRGLFVIPGWIASRLPGAPSSLAPALTAALAIVVLAASAYSLLRNYKYPKQDFEGAMRFVDAESKEGDAVVTAGATTFPFQHYYLKHWDSVDTADQVREIARHSSAVWMVYTFPRYLQGAAPTVMEMIQREFTVVRVFPGTVGDGDLFVARLVPRRPRTAEGGSR